LDLEDIKAVMEDINDDTDSKTVVRRFEAMAKRRDISLKLRKK
jgi:hypothetical protein